MKSLKQRFKEEVKEQVEQPIDDLEIKQYLPNVSIYTYNKLKNVRRIEELLPTDKSYAIILYLNTPNSGHWVSLMRYKPTARSEDTIEYFDSYAGKVDAPLLWLSLPERQQLGTDVPYITRLLNSALLNHFKVVYNTCIYQKTSNDISTCGRHSIHRIQKMLQGMGLKEYHKYMNKLKKDNALNYDELVSTFIQT